MKVFIAIPSYGGMKCLPMIDSLRDTIQLLDKQGHSFILATRSGLCYVQLARNELLKEFLDSDCDSLFWLDDDVSWNPEDVLRMLNMEDEIVAGVYRKKTDTEEYPIAIDTDEDGKPIVREDGCILAPFIPAGFWRIRRSAIEKMCSSYPEQAYFMMQHGEKVTGFFDLFPQGLYNGQWWGEDFGFCRLWKELGKIWLVPDINLVHHGPDGKSYPGNYHKFLLKQPGGSEAQ